MHCKDPECLTGCPTGAIFRDPRGHVDIDPELASAVLTALPNVLTTRSRWCRQNATEPVRFDLFGSLKQKLSLAPPEPPLPPPAADDVIAIKCNLCEHTGLNLQVRKDPLTPAKKIARRSARASESVDLFRGNQKYTGIIFRDKTHAIVRNIHKSDPLAKLWHFRIAMTVIIGVLIVGA